MTDPRSDFLVCLDLLAQVIYMWVVYAVSPKWMGGDATKAHALATRIWPLVERILQLAPEALVEQMALLNGAIVRVSEGSWGTLGTAAAEAWHGLLSTILTAYRADLKAHKTIDPSQVDLIISAALERASFLGVGSRAVTMLFEALVPKRLNFMNWLGPTLAQLSGYDEIVAKARAPQYDHAFGNLAEYNAAATFRTRAPSGGDAHELRARRLITEGQYQKLLGWDGLMEEFEDPMLQGAYHALSPFLLLRVVDSEDVTDATIRSFLEFTGTRPIDVDRMIDVVHELRLKPYRAKALAAFTTAFERGAIPPDQFDSFMDTFSVPHDARPFVKLETSIRKLQQLDEIYRKSVSEGYKYGTVSDADYVPHMEAIGIAEADARAHYALDSVLKLGKASAAMHAAEAREAQREQRAAVATATAAFRAGTIDEAGLTAALLAAGLTPALVAHAVALQVERRIGAQRHLYGLLLDPAAADQLRRDVAVIQEQVVKKLIGTEIARSQLSALHLPSPTIDALLARWAAQALGEILPP
jgi:hypothetical protein